MSKYVSSVRPGEGKQGKTKRWNKKRRLGFLINSTRDSSGGGCRAGSTGQDLQNKKYPGNPQCHFSPPLISNELIPHTWYMRKKKLPGYKRGETQLLIARQWARIRSYVAALEDLGWILKNSVAMAVIAIHGNSTQWCENNLLFDLVPKTSSFCFLSPKTQAFISLCSGQNWAFHFQQW